MTKHEFYEGIFNFKIVRPDGKVLYEITKRNNLADEGESVMLDSFFRAQNTPTTYYLRLARCAAVDTSILTTLTGEPTGYGYAAAELARSVVGWPTLEIDDGDYRVVSKEITWTASGGDIGPVNLLYLATTINNTGKLIAYLTLPADVIISEGNSGIAQYRIKLK